MRPGATATAVAGLGGGAGPFRTGDVESRTVAGDGAGRRASHLGFLVVCASAAARMAGVRSG